MPKTILLVEDDENIASIYIRVLEKSGFNTLHAADGETGFEMALENSPDLILLDIMLPQKQGLTILQELRDHEDTKDLPVYILSVLSDERMKKKAAEVGANGYIVKSEIDAYELVDHVKEVF